MLTLTFLGVGSAFAKRNFQSNVLVEAWTDDPDQAERPDAVLLIDLGTTGPLALHALKDLPEFAYLNQNGRVYYPALDRILITHMHFDHIGGLAELALANRFLFHEHRSDAPFRPRLYSTAAILHDLWAHALKGGLNTVPGRHAVFEDYFVTQSLQPEAGDAIELSPRYRVRIFPTDHIQIATKYDWPCYGVLFEDTQTGATAFYSGDTRFDWAATGSMMQSANICFHDVQLTLNKPRDPASRVHASLEELHNLPSDVKHKTWLYHYGDEWDNGCFDTAAADFAGFARSFERYPLLP